MLLTPTRATGCGAFKSPSGTPGKESLVTLPLADQLDVFLMHIRHISVIWVFCVRNMSQLVSYICELNQDLKLLCELDKTQMHLVAL